MQQLSTRGSGELQSDGLERPARRRWRAQLVVTCVAVVVGLGLCAPALHSGFQLEDREQRAVVLAPAGWTRLFGAPGHHLARNRYAKDAGDLPWIAASDFNLAFWRPLTALTHRVDHELWPSDPVRMHAQSLAWFAVLVSSLGLLYGRLCSTPLVAGLATLLYATDDARGLVVGWLANRSTLIASSFVVLALWLHDRRGRERWRSGAWLGPASFWLALQAGELALGGLGYVVAYQLFLGSGSARARLRGLLPWVAVALIWALPYGWLGYGARGSGIYLDPASQPLELLGAMALRLPALLLGATSGWPVEAWTLAALRIATLDQTTVALVLVLCAASLAVVLVPLSRIGLGADPCAGAPEPPRRHTPRALARFWVTGGLLSALPACSAGPGDRMTFLVALGGTALVAAMLERIWLLCWRRRGAVERWALWPMLGLGSVVFVSHGVLSPCVLPERSLGTRRADDAVLTAVRSAFDGVRPALDELYFLNVPDYFMGWNVNVAGRRQGLAPPRSRVLYGATAPARVLRESDTTLLIRSTTSFFDTPTSELFRSPRLPMRRGETLALTGLVITVLDTNRAGHPTAVRFRFATSLDDEHLRFKHWDGQRFADFPMPPVGARVALPLQGKPALPEQARASARAAAGERRSAAARADAVRRL